MTDITELAQSHELLIANGQQTADLLRHLADNEIDSDYFAVVSECESYGQETDAELSITEFALRAAVYVDELVDALEKAQQRIAELDIKNCELDSLTQRWAVERAENADRIAELENDEVRQRLANAEHQLYMAELAKHNLKASRKSQFRKRRAAEKRIAELESRTVKMPHRNLGHPKLFLLCPFPYYDAEDMEKALAAAGIRVEAG
ncbi:hypothetical protein ACKLKB_05765 [Klebsiella pneumoniae]|nr:hypothetical protein [Klebsiella pneumoniae]